MHGSEVSKKAYNFGNSRCRYVISAATTFATLVIVIRGTNCTLKIPPFLKPSTYLLNQIIFLIFFSSILLKFTLLERKSASSDIKIILLR